MSKAARFFARLSAMKMTMTRVLSIVWTSFVMIVTLVWLEIADSSGDEDNENDEEKDGGDAENECDDDVIERC